VQVLVDGGDDLAVIRVCSEPVALSLDVPLGDPFAARRELDDRAVTVSVRTGLPLRADSVLEAGEQVPADRGDVVRLAQRFLVQLARSSLGVEVVQALPDRIWRTSYDDPLGRALAGRASTTMLSTTDVTTPATANILAAGRVTAPPITLCMPGPFM
jgi:hypothetical protein